MPRRVLQAVTLAILCGTGGTALASEVTDSFKLQARSAPGAVMRVIFTVKRIEGVKRVSATHSTAKVTYDDSKTSARAICDSLIAAGFTCTRDVAQR